MGIRFRIRSLLVVVAIVGALLDSIRAEVRYYKYQLLQTQAKTLTFYKLEFSAALASKRLESEFIRPGTNGSEVRSRLHEIQVRDLEDRLSKVSRRYDNLDLEAQRIWGPLR